MARAVVFFSALTHVEAGAGTSSVDTCAGFKNVFQVNGCCDDGSKSLDNVQIRPKNDAWRTSSKIVGVNPCKDAVAEVARANQKCFADSVVDAIGAVFANVSDVTQPYPVGPQSGADVTLGFKGEFNTSTIMSNTSGVITYGIEPNMYPFRDGAKAEHGGLGPLCPVNVHWHLGAEHRSEGQYDENGLSPNKYDAAYNSAPMGDYEAAAPRRLGSDPVRYGFACRLFDASDSKFTTEYDWKHCQDMHVGVTYEVHWPHSVLGACGTPFQYQTKFYDGIFCRFARAKSPALSAQQIASNVGVQAQVFTIVNDEDYYYPDLMKGMIVTDQFAFGRDLAIYAGSSTGTGRDNTWCSMYTPITWQVDRTCHLISASSFDKMCADMKLNHDPMDNDLHPHGARELVVKALNSDRVIGYDHGADAEQAIPR